MRKILLSSALLVILASCKTQKNIPSQNTNEVKKVEVEIKEVPKPEVQRTSCGDYYKDNIGDSSKGDNTISHGSIVSASPKKYKVVKDYFPAVAQNFRIKYVILHYTALDEEKSIKVLTQQSVSSHYLVNDKDDKEIYQLVDENKRAYHSGVSAWKNDKMLNDTSIGIEVINSGFKVENKIKTFFEYPEHQFEKVAMLVKDIVDRYQIPPTNVLGHSDVAPDRKQDPGPLFPWKKLYDEYQVGMWYDDEVKNTFLASITPESFDVQSKDTVFIAKVQSEFKLLGYDLESSGKWDAKAKSVVVAFQYHFRPEKYDGILDAETWAILQALNKKYSKK